jgi:hypothetical protein
MDKKHAHLVIIQGVINRLSQNSFLLKGWSVVLIAALFALAAKDSNAMFVYLAYFPLFAFWFLDGYFLWQERLYRNLYDKVRIMDESNIDFSMNTTDIEDSRGGWLSATFSKSLIAFHGVVFGSLVIVMLIMISNG